PGLPDSGLLRLQHPPQGRGPVAVAESVAVPEPVAFTEPEPLAESLAVPERIAQRAPAAPLAGEAEPAGQVVRPRVRLRRVEDFVGKRSGHGRSPSRLAAHGERAAAQLGPLAHGGEAD